MNKRGVAGDMGNRIAIANVENSEGWGHRKVNESLTEVETTHEKSRLIFNLCKRVAILGSNSLEKRHGRDRFDRETSHTGKTCESRENRDCSKRRTIGYRDVDQRREHGDDCEVLTVIDVQVRELGKHRNSLKLVTAVDLERRELAESVDRGVADDAHVWLLQYWKGYLRPPTFLNISILETPYMLCMRHLKRPPIPFALGYRGPFLL
jgi:hypothetical protein